MHSTRIVIGGPFPTEPYRENREIMVNWELRRDMQKNFHNRNTVAVLLVIPIFNLVSVTITFAAAFLLLRSLGTRDCFLTPEAALLSLGGISCLHSTSGLFDVT